MKKRITIITVAAWIAYILFMTVWVIQGVMLNTEIQSRLTWLLWASVLVMFLTFYLLKISSVPKPKIQSGLLYTIEKVIAHNYRDHTVVLNHDEKIEIFRCRFVSNLDSLKTGEKYTVEKIDGDLFFTPA